MVFSSLIFLFLYLPIVLLIYYCISYKYRNLFLFIANLFFYAWGEPIFVLLMLFSTVSDYIHGYFIGKYRETNKKKAKVLVVSAVIINIGLLAVFKYTGFLCETLNLLPFINLPMLSIPLPLGISFYTFQTMSYSIDVYRGDAPVQKNIISFGTYVSLFPQLIAGPIVRYKDVAEQIDNRRENLDDFTKGVRKFLIGLGKKVLIANQMGLLWDTIRTNYTDSIIMSWIGIIAYTFQIYFDFSGYSDMACGLGNMFGFEFLKNFNYPYISKSISEFWRRWHISLGTWFREYVYIPLGGNRKGKARLLLNTFIVWFLTGFWHGASWNFILWGLYFGVIIVTEKFFLQKILDKLPSFISHIYASFLIVFGWVIFYFEDLGEMGKFISSLFNFSAFSIGNDALVLLLAYIPILIIALFASLPFGSILYEKVKNMKYYWIADALFCVVILVICSSALVSDGYNPFLYLRF